MARLIRRRKINNFIIFGNHKSRQLVDTEYNVQKQMNDVWLKKSNPELFLIIIAGIGMGLAGYAIYNLPGLFIGMMGGTLITTGIFAFFQPAIRPYKITIPATSIIGWDKISSLKGGTHYFYCPNYDSVGNALPLQNDPLSIAVIQNQELEKQIILMREQIQNLQIALEEQQKPLDSQLGKNIGHLRDMASAVRPYIQPTKGKISSMPPEWLKGNEEDENG